MNILIYADLYIVLFRIKDISFSTFNLLMKWSMSHQNNMHPLQVYTIFKFYDDVTDNDDVVVVVVVLLQL